MADSHGRMANCEKTFEMPLIQFKNLTNFKNNKKDKTINEKR